MRALGWAELLRLRLGGSPRRQAPPPGRRPCGGSIRSTARRSSPKLQLPSADFWTASPVFRFSHAPDECDNGQNESPDSAQRRREGRPFHHWILRRQQLAHTHTPLSPGLTFPALTLTFVLAGQPTPMSCVTARNDSRVSHPPVVDKSVQTAPLGFSLRGTPP